MTTDPLKGYLPLSTALGLTAPSADDEYHRSQQRTKLDQALEVLSPRESFVITGLYGLIRESQSPRQIASTLHLNVEGVQTIEKRALEKLRNEATNIGLKL